MKTPISIDSIREAVARQNERLGDRVFLERQTPEGWTIFNYGKAATGHRHFAGPDEAVLRECRGICFDAHGVLLSRPYHKFFNADDLPETSWSLLDFSKKHWLLEKLDGVMVRPLWTDDGVLVLASRGGFSSQAKLATEWLRGEHSVLDLCTSVMGYGATPIYEWCSNRSRIVIAHPEDRLVLTAIRNHDGSYWTHDTVVAMADSFRAQCVRAVLSPVSLLEEAVFRDHVRQLRDQEGFVLRFTDGLMVKLKAEEYLARHATLDILKSERAIVRAILESGRKRERAAEWSEAEGEEPGSAGRRDPGDDFDTLVASVRDVDRDALRRFEADFRGAVGATAVMAMLAVEKGRAECSDDRAEFVVKMGTGHPLFSFYMRLFSSKEMDVDGVEDQIWELLRYEMITKNRKNADCIRSFVGGLRWDDYRSQLGSLGEE